MGFSCWATWVCNCQCVEVSWRKSLMSRAKAACEQGRHYKETFKLGTFTRNRSTERCSTENVKCATAEAFQDFICVCCACRGTQQTSLEQSSPPQSNTPGTPPSYKLPPLLGNYEGKDDFPLRKTGI